MYHLFDHILLRQRRLQTLALCALLASTAPQSVGANVPPLQETCPLNSGGESLLGTEWRLFSIYGNTIPAGLEISMKVQEDALSGFTGCNDYTAHFKKVGHTGFMMTGAEKGQQACQSIIPPEGGARINSGDWEGSYIRTLQRAGSVQQQGNSLYFYNRNGDPAIIFVKKYGSL